VVFSFWGERSTYHKTCVRRVHAHLRRKYGIADFERSLVSDRITDAWGYDKKSKTWYLCEIKVNWSDLQKAPLQIHDTALRFKKNHKDSAVVPVIALPLKLQKELVKINTWNSFCDTCKKLNMAIWVIEQSSVRQIQSPRHKTSKAITSKPKVTKIKIAATKKTKSKSLQVKARGKSAKGKSIRSSITKIRNTKSKTAKAKR